MAVCQIQNKDLLNGFGEVEQIELSYRMNSQGNQMNLLHDIYSDKA